MNVITLPVYCLLALGEPCAEDPNTDLNNNSTQSPSAEFHKLAEYSEPVKLYDSPEIIQGNGFYEHYIALEVVGNSERSCLFGVRVPQSLDYGTTPVEGAATQYWCTNQLVYDSLIEARPVQEGILGNHPMPGVNIGNLDAEATTSVPFLEENYQRPRHIDLRLHFGSW